MVSRYGTRGGLSSTSTPKRRFMRSTVTSTCTWLMPETIISPVWSSRCTSHHRVFFGEAAQGGDDLVLVALGSWP